MWSSKTWRVGGEAGIRGGGKVSGARGGGGARQRYSAIVPPYRPKYVDDGGCRAGEEEEEEVRSCMPWSDSEETAVQESLKAGFEIQRCLHARFAAGRFVESRTSAQEDVGGEARPSRSGTKVKGWW